MSEKDLIPASMRSLEEVKENGRKGGIKSGQVRREKKLMSQIYADVLSKQHNIKDGSDIQSVIQAIIKKKDSSSVSMIREIREATEGKKIEVNTNVDKELGEFVSSLREHATDKEKK